MKPKVRIIPPAPERRVVAAPEHKARVTSKTWTGTADEGNYASRKDDRNEVTYE